MTLRGQIGLALIVAAVVLWAQRDGVRPSPAPGPQPTPAVSPFGDGAFRVMLVRETDQPMDAQRATVANAKEWREYVLAKGGEFRVLDPDTEWTGPGSPEPWKRTMATVKDRVPCVVIGSAQGGSVEDYPASPERMLELVRLWGEQ